MLVDADDGPVELVVHVQLGVDVEQRARAAARRATMRTAFVAASPASFQPSNATTRMRPRWNRFVWAPPPLPSLRPARPGCPD